MCKNNNGRVFDESKVLKDNAMLKVRPELFWEWDFEKNDELGYDVYKVTKGMNKYAWWKCDKCTGVYFARIADKTDSSTSCSYCSGRKVLIGFNDIWTTKPELASLLADHEDGYRYSKGSGVKVNWNCPNCGKKVMNKQINEINKQGLSCKSCGDGMSYPEKVVYHMLRYLKIDFEYDISFSWSHKKRYDFYILDYNMIIEVHGIQHYEETSGSFDERNLIDEIENDKLKKRMAKNNGILNYIVIDARYSKPIFIKESILNSELFNIVDSAHTDWDRIFKLAESSLVLETNRLWMNGIQNVSEISERLKLHSSTIRRYLKRGKDNGWSDYCPNKSKLNGSKLLQKEVIRIDDNGDHKVYKSITEASAENNLKSRSTITQVCKGKRKTAGGFKWMYIEEFENKLAK